MKLPYGHFTLTSSCSTGSTVCPLVLWPLLRRVAAGERRRGRWRSVPVAWGGGPSLGLLPSLGHTVAKARRMLDVAVEEGLLPPS